MKIPTGSVRPVAISIQIDFRLVAATAVAAAEATEATLVAELGKCRKSNVAARIAAAAEDASAWGKKAQWELPVIKGLQVDQVRRDIRDQRVSRARKERKETQDRQDQVDPKETGVKWEFPGSQESMEFTDFKDLQDQEDLAG